MDLATVTYIINGLLAVALYFLKSAHDDLKQSIEKTNTRSTALELELSNVKDKYFKKEDFTEFKKELWARLDRMEDDFKNQIQELKK